MIKKGAFLPPHTITRIQSSRELLLDLCLSSREARGISRSFSLLFFSLLPFPFQLILPLSLSVQSSSLSTAVKERRSPRFPLVISKQNEGQINISKIEANEECLFPACQKSRIPPSFLACLPAFAVMCEKKREQMSFLPLPSVCLCVRPFRSLIVMPMLRIWMRNQ